MEKDKSPMHAAGGGLPPTASRYTAYASPSGSLFPPKCEASSSSPSLDSGRFSHDVNQMPDYPPKNAGHRRAQSEILSLPDDISFDSDLGVMGSGEGPLSYETEEDLISMYLDMDKLASSSATSGLDLTGSADAPVAAVSTPSPMLAGNVASSSSDNPRARHQHSLSMDDSSYIKPEVLSAGTEGMSLTESKKAMSAAKLADLALIDPKRAKRIWANRQSAARSKERKMRYIAELERKVQTLQTESTTLSAQFTMLQRNNTGLTTENSELKLRLQTMEQQVRLQDALNDSLRDEVQRLKILTGQGVPNGGQKMMNFGQSLFGKTQQFYPHNHGMQSHLAAQQLQQLQIHSQHQQQMPPHQNQHQVQQPQQSFIDLTVSMGTRNSQTRRESPPDVCNPPRIE